uniref:Uncharacterized protein n=1 Tax=Pyxicephalus adspersus TaxID=30357 RepID=A0AAV2ZRG4_PYXAD|nr:TPA: hypothetical protein GDO54_003957 [Pyxicephalus adspersus]
MGLRGVLLGLCGGRAPLCRWGSRPFLPSNMAAELPGSGLVAAGAAGSGLTAAGPANSGNMAAGAVGSGLMAAGPASSGNMAAGAAGSDLMAAGAAGSVALEGRPVACRVAVPAAAGGGAGGGRKKGAAGGRGSAPPTCFQAAGLVANDSRPAGSGTHRQPWADPVADCAADPRVEAVGSIDVRQPPGGWEGNVQPIDINLTHSSLRALPVGQGGGSGDSFLGGAPFEDGAAGGSGGSARATVGHRRLAPQAAAGPAAAWAPPALEDVDVEEEALGGVRSEGEVSEAEDESRAFAAPVVPGWSAGAASGSAGLSGPGKSLGLVPLGGVLGGLGEGMFIQVLGVLGGGAAGPARCFRDIGSSTSGAGGISRRWAHGGLDRGRIKRGYRGGGWSEWWPQARFEGVLGGWGQLGGRE